MKYFLWIAFFVVMYVSSSVCGETIETLPYEPLTMITDANGDRWYCFGREGGGVVRERDGIFEQFTPENSGLASDTVIGIAEDTFENIFFLLGHSVLGIGSFGCSRYDGNEWDSYYPFHRIDGWCLDDEGKFWISCSMPYFDTDRHYECFFDGETWRAYLVRAPYSNVSFTRRFSNGEWEIEGLNTEDIAGGYGNKFPLSDNFPLTVGSMWSYKRTIGEFSDMVTVIVAGTTEQDGHTWAVMLDGRAFRQDEDGNVYLLGAPYAPYFDFRSCEGENCDPYYLHGPFTGVYVARDTFSGEVPAGSYTGWNFYTSFGVTIGGYSQSLAPGVGMVVLAEFTDFGLQERWELLSYNIKDYSVHVVESDMTPSSFVITGVYPNPFNSSVTIEYVLPASNNVTFEVYNLTGQRVYSRVIYMLGPGGHRVTWNGHAVDGSRAAAGLYFLRVRADSFTATAKVMYIK